MPIGPGMHEQQGLLVQIGHMEYGNQSCNWERRQFQRSGTFQNVGILIFGESFSRRSEDGHDAGTKGDLACEFLRRGDLCYCPDRSWERTGADW